jgi:hypothetical protein
MVNGTQIVNQKLIVQLPLIQEKPLLSNRDRFPRFNARFDRQNAIAEENCDRKRRLTPVGSIDSDGPACKLNKERRVRSVRNVLTTVKKRRLKSRIIVEVTEAAWGRNLP